MFKQRQALAPLDNLVQSMVGDIAQVGDHVRIRVGRVDAGTGQQWIRG